PEHEDEMTEVHRVARVTVWAGGDDPVRINIHAPAAAGAGQAIAADQQILQIAPDEQHASPRHEHQRAAPQYELGGDDREWAEQERLPRCLDQPSQHSKACDLHGSPRIVVGLRTSRGLMPLWSRCRAERSTGPRRRGASMWWR